MAGRKRRQRSVDTDKRATYAAWAATVLAVDTAHNSGWAIRTRGKLLWSGEVDTTDEHEVNDIVQLALQCAQTLPCALVLERPWGGRNVTTIMGLGAARDRWRAAWARAGQSNNRLVSVYPVTWRARVLGPHSVRLKREAVRSLEKLVASLESNLHATAIGDDEAAAICISKWAAHAHVVAQRLPGSARNGRR